MTDRELLAAAMRHLYAKGWRRMPGLRHAWTAPDRAVAVELEYAERCGMQFAWLRWRRGDDRPWSQVAVVDVREAVYMLWAVGILPHELTSAYVDGYADGAVDALAAVKIRSASRRMGLRELRRELLAVGAQ